MQLTVLKYPDSEEQVAVRTALIDGDVWFVGSDICDVLGYSNSRDALIRHCKSRGVAKRDTPTSSGVQSLTFINESNVYRLLAKSKLPSAEKFEEWLFEEVLPEIRKTGGYGRTGLTVFAKRVLKNYLRPAPGYFSVISELYLLLQGRFEAAGYVIKDFAGDGKEIRPDISVGIGFSKHLKINYPKITDAYTFYDHEFESGMQIPARQYHDSLLSLFRDYVLNYWIPECSHEYLVKRDPDAVKYIPAVIGSQKVTTHSSAKSVK